MIDRAQVLHVARLARLDLAAEEVERMARELSAVLGHIEKIEELELEGVEPTSHVIDVVGALRPDEPRPSLPRDVALASAPEVVDDGFGVPSPGAEAARSAAVHERPEVDRRDQDAGQEAPRR
jgi:aspartyl-tRNA(Asn)/glutamyl-tRNA(Gln) amidotransferase subunit C